MAETAPNSPIKEKKIYTIEVNEHEDGSQSMCRTNDGFQAIELLGLLDLTRMEIGEQIRGAFRPDFIERKVVES